LSENAKAELWVPGADEDAKCPVGLVQQAWIESSMLWFVDQFGKDVVMRDVVPPTRDFLPDPYFGKDHEVADLFFGRMWQRFEPQVRQVLLSLDKAHGEQGDRKNGARAVGHYQVKDGVPFVWLAPELASDLVYLVAVMAHELCHVRLIGEGRVDPDRKDQERLTDLLTVFFGFGIFTTNVALEFEEADRRWKAHPIGYLDEYRLNASRNNGVRCLGYLDEPEFGYALACYAWLRGETYPVWAKHLDPGPRMYLRQGLEHLSAETRPGEFPTTRKGRVSIRIVSGDPLSSLPLYLPAPPPDTG
jgi:hypothetical protein